MRCSNVGASVVRTSVATATNPHSPAADAFLAPARDRPARLLRGATDAEELDRRLVGDVSDRVLHVDQQAVAACAQLAGAQAAIELERVRARHDVRVEARSDRL